MKAVAAKSSANDTLTRNRQGTNHKQVSVKISVPAFSGSIALIQRKALCPCDGGCPGCTGMIQAKLKIGQPNDMYEQEADRVADMVMRMPEPKQSLVNGHSSSVQRKSTCPECLEEDKVIQAKPMADQITPLINLQNHPDYSQEPEVASNIESGINSLKGEGEPLPESIRSFFELRFGTDLSQVRVHNNARSDRLNHSLNARAFTAGKDILFAYSEYRPWCNEGRRLLAHELTHAIQQSSIHTPTEGPGRLNIRISNTDRGIVQCTRYKFEGVVVEGNPPNFPPGFDFLDYFEDHNLGIGDPLTPETMEILNTMEVRRDIEDWVFRRTGLNVFVRMRLSRGRFRPWAFIVLEVNKRS